jgi:hypothetical protein
LLFADESHFAGDRAHQGALQRLITEPSLAVEKKFRDVVSCINLLHLIIASNESWVVPIALIGERRYFVPVIDESKAGDRSYFNALIAQMEHGGTEAMLHDLLARDIREFDVRDVPSSEGLIEQKTHSLDSLSKWWLAVLSRGYLYQSKFGVPLFAEWGQIVSTEILWSSYLQWADATGERWRQTREMLGRRLTELGYQSCRPRGKSVIGEVEVLTSDPRQRGGAYLDKEAVMEADHQPSYNVGTLRQARDAFILKTGIVGDLGQSEPGEDDD